MLGRFLRGWPLPGWVFPAVALVMAGLTFLANLSLLRLEYPLWSQVSTAWHESVWIPGAVLTTLAVPIGSALSQEASPVAPGGRAREGAGLTLAHAAALGGWAAIGHAVGMGPAVFRAVAGATWGTLDWQDATIGSLGVVLLAVVGVCAGMLLRRWFLAPVVGIVVFVLMGLPNPPLWRPLGLFGPVRQLQATPRFELPLATTIFGMIAMACVAVAAAHVVTWARQPHAAHQGLVEPLGWVGAVLALVVTAFVWRPELYVEQASVPRSCHDVDGVQVCLHAANEPARDDVDTATAALAQAGVGPLLDQVTDEAVADTSSRRPGEALIDLYPGPFQARDALQSVEEVAADSITSSLVSGRCPFGSAAGVYSRSLALQERIFTLAGYERVVDSTGGGFEGEDVAFFREMDADELTGWVQKNKKSIAKCHIAPLQDLP